MKVVKHYPQFCIFWQDRMLIGTKVLNGDICPRSTRRWVLLRHSLVPEHPQGTRRRRIKTALSFFVPSLRPFASCHSGAFVIRFAAAAEGMRPSVLIVSSISIETAASSRNGELPWSGENTHDSACVRLWTSNGPARESHTELEASRATSIRRGCLSTHILSPRPKPIWKSQFSFARLRRQRQTLK